jgi:hypothetical protein
MASLYLLSEGDPVKFKKMKDKIAYNQTKYDDDVYLTSALQLTSHNSMKISWHEKIILSLYVYFSIAWLWASSLTCKKYIRPYTRTCIDNFLRKHSTEHIKYKWNISKCIYIHIRCSDIPFNRFRTYNLYDCNWYKDAINLALKLHPEAERIVLVSCNDHTGAPETQYHVNKSIIDNNKYYCGKFLEQYAQFIKSHGTIPVEIACNSLESDIHLLLNCGCLIATIGSFAYYLGLSSDNTFITSENLAGGYVRDGMFVVKGGVILHDQVKNYYDQSFIKQMNCSV